MVMNEDGTNMVPFGIQLYSVRDHLAVDPAGTLRELKEVGYDHVELFGVEPEQAEDWKEMLDDADVQAVAAHVDYDIILDNLDGAIEMARCIGFEDIIVPWLNLDGAEEWVHAALQLEEAGAKVRRQGLRLGYHNHDHEFQPIGKTTPFDILFEYSQPDNLFLELDVRWASEAGGDATAIIREFGARCRFLHLKERPAPGQGEFAELGNGVIDWGPIFEVGRKARVQWYIVEQDESDGDSIESAAINAEFMRKQ